MHRIPYLTAVCLGLLAMGISCIAGCDQGQSGPGIQITCQQEEIVVRPGEKTNLPNPCEFSPGISSDGRWAPGDDFELGSLPLGVKLDENVDINGKVTRQLEALSTYCGFPIFSACVEPVENVPTGFFYNNGGFRFYAGPTNHGVFAKNDVFLKVSTVAPLQVSLTANPAAINAGESSLLTPSAEGGLPPYSFVLTLPDHTVSPFRVTPTATTTYTVNAVDSFFSVDSIPPSGEATATATVTVNSSSFTLTVVDPNFNQFVHSPRFEISCFNGSGCSAPFAAGSPVTLTVDDNSAAWVGCLNFTRTTCTVTMDADKTVTVLPKLAGSASANPSAITVGSTSQLLAIVAGGMLPYSFSWTPSDTLNNATVANPVATPATTTLYTVQITDGVGQTISRSAAVTVQ